jgi:molybdopterin synthase sulfur carrier subunit
MVIKVRFIGSLRSSAQKSKLELSPKEAATLKQLVNMVVELLPELRNALIDVELNDPRPNVLVLVNERDISVLEGLQTKIKDGDEVSFIPVVHGG